MPRYLSANFSSYKMAVAKKIAGLGNHPSRNQHPHMGYRQDKMITHLFQHRLLHRHGTVVGGCQATHHPPNTDRQRPGNGTELPFTLPGRYTAGKGGEALAKKLFQWPVMGEKSCDITAMMRCSQSDDPAWLLLRIIVEKTPDHQSTEAVPNEMGRGSGKRGKELLQTFCILSQVTMNGTVTKLPDEEALPAQPKSQ